VNFFPELDFSVFDTLEQFEPVWPAEAREGGAVTSALEPIVWAGPLPPTDEPEGFVLRDERRRFTAGSRQATIRFSAAGG